MARTITTAGTRIGIITLAALGAFALPVSIGVAQASTRPVAVAAADCAAMQASYDSLQIREDILQERLATAPPAQKPGLVKQILKLEKQMGVLRQQMDAAGCP